MVCSISDVEQLESFTIAPFLKAAKNMKWLKTSFSLLLFCAVGTGCAYAQDACSFESTLQAMQGLEGQSDPKCHATATRLEYSIYGTPLTVGANRLKHQLQKQFIDAFWAKASVMAIAKQRAVITAELLEQSFLGGFPFQCESAGGARLYLLSGDILSIEPDDLRHYSSVAYSLRAMLALKQDALFRSASARVPLAADAEAALIRATDVLTLAMLQLADQAARATDTYEIQAPVLQRAWDSILHLPAVDEALGGVAATERMQLLPQLIERKLKAYEAYNEIRSKVFLRNLQVYFARFKWPKDAEGGLEFKRNFTEANALFLADLMTRSAQRAIRAGSPLVREAHVHAALQVLTPHELNAFEDVVYFPRFAESQQVKIESYDMDSFRDSGLHWRYLSYALEKVDAGNMPEPDPFAAELLVEGVAQFAVLLLRLSGELAAASAAETLQPQHLYQAFERYNQLLQQHGQLQVDEPALAKLPSRRSGPDGESTRFSEMTDASGLQYQHHSSDWLHRLLRGYLKTGEHSATLSVPPAFGGGGIAAEDVNNDGFVDLLLVGGRGVALFLNQGDRTFREMTQAAGLDWKRADGNGGEARQPLIADFDNDGLQDILITYADDAHRLYRGVGNCKFEDVTELAGLGGQGLVAGPALTFDYDRDGLLDVYIGYFGNYLEGHLPNLSRKNFNATPNKLFRNEGGFRFREVTIGSGTGNTGWTQALGHTDLDGDGWQDLIVGNDFGINAYLRNQGDGSFVDIAAKLGTNKPSFTMNVGIADLNQDLLPDIYISNIVTMVKDDKYVLPSADTTARFNLSSLATMRVVDANDLFMSERKNGELVAHRQARELMGRGNSATGWSWDADFFDADNDGDDDLYCVNGMNDYHVYSETPYFTAVNHTEAEIQLVPAKRATNVFFENEDGKMKNHSEGSGLDLMSNSRSAAFLDLDNDGDLDVALNDYHASAKCFLNHAERLENNWLKVKLVGDPAKGNNRDAIGARLLLETESGQTLWREIHGGGGYLSQDPKVQHFGLGRDQAKQLLIRWPNGAEQVVQNLKLGELQLIEDH